MIYRRAAWVSGFYYGPWMHQSGLFERRRAVFTARATGGRKDRSWLMRSG